MYEIVEEQKYFKAKKRNIPERSEITKPPNLRSECGSRD